MLEWLVASCLLVILVVLVWPRARCSSGTACHQPEVLLHRAGLSARVEGDGTARAALICKPSALAKYLQKHCRTLSNYAPCAGWTWRASAVLQTVHEACWPHDGAVQFVRDNLQLSDDGLVSLDWAVPSYHRRRRTSSHSTSPVLLVVPNSFGKITRNVLKVNLWTRPRFVVVVQ